MLIKLAAYGVVMSATAAFISADLIPIGAAVALTAAILFGLLVAAILKSRLSSNRKDNTCTD